MSREVRNASDRLTAASSSFRCCLQHQRRVRGGEVERWRDRERQRERQTERQRERESARGGEAETETETERVEETMCTCSLACLLSSFCTLTCISLRRCWRSRKSRRLCSYTCAALICDEAVVGISYYKHTATHKPTQVHRKTHTNIHRHSKHAGNGEATGGFTLW